jgi:hypothetical protein
MPEGKVKWFKVTMYLCTIQKLNPMDLKRLRKIKR